MKQLAILAMLTMFAAPAWAASVNVTGAFARATPPGADTGVVYMTLESDDGDAVTGVSTPAAATAMIHKTTMAGMVMSMDAMDRLDLPAGQKVILRPDQLHIMLQGLKHPLIKGTTIRLRLTFAKAAAADITVLVASLGASAAGE